MIFQINIANALLVNDFNASSSLLVLFFFLLFLGFLLISMCYNIKKIEREND